MERVGPDSHDRPVKMRNSGNKGAHHPVRLSLSMQDCAQQIRSIELSVAARYFPPLVFFHVSAERERRDIDKAKIQSTATAKFRKGSDNQRPLLGLVFCCWSIFLTIIETLIGKMVSRCHVDKKSSNIFLVEMRFPSWGPF